MYNINDFNVFKVAYDNSKIYLFTNNNYIKTYSNLLEELSSTQYNISSNDFCTDPLVSNEIVYFNMKSNTLSACSGIKTIDINNKISTIKDTIQAPYYIKTNLALSRQYYALGTISSVAKRDSAFFIASNEGLGVYEQNSTQELELKNFISYISELSDVYIKDFIVDEDYLYVITDSGFYIMQIKDNYIQI